MNADKRLSACGTHPQAEPNHYLLKSVIQEEEHTSLPPFFNHRVEYQLKSLRKKLSPASLIVGYESRGFRILIEAENSRRGNMNTPAIFLILSYFSEYVLYLSCCYSYYRVSTTVIDE